jgi:hypothetical protein
VLGPVIRNYEEHYDSADAAPPQRFSQKIKGFFQKWEIKFTPAYYEAREKEKAAAQAAESSPQPERPPSP